jgi:predicted peptidase
MKKNLVLLNLVLTFFLGSSFLSTASVLTDSAMVVNNTSHKILFCIPDDYDPNNTYPLVIGIHYCGGSASEYRNALVSLTDSLGVIIACPDYFSNQVPDGDTNMFKILVDTASSIYNINSDEIFLTGMSCNGDYSLRQGLNKVYPFKGIFPWAPWVSTSSPEVFN